MSVDPEIYERALALAEERDIGVERAMLILQAQRIHHAQFSQRTNHSLITLSASVESFIRGVEAVVRAFNDFAKANPKFVAALAEDRKRRDAEKDDKDDRD